MGLRAIKHMNNTISLFLFIISCVNAFHRVKTVSKQGFVGTLSVSPKLVDTPDERMSILQLSNEKDIIKIGGAISSLFLFAIPVMAYSQSDAVFDDRLWRYFLAGGVSCSFSHGIAVPFDVIKTRIQINSKTDGDGISAVAYLQRLVQEEGTGMLLKGFGPTLAGYTVQGSLKYGFYEVFKTALRPFLEDTTWLHVNLESIEGKLLLFAVAGALADTIGSIALSPFESARIRLVASPLFANGLIPTISKIVEQEGIIGLFKGLPALLLKQIPYTTVQLGTFELMTSQIFSSMFTSGMTAATILPYKFLVTLSSACVAAILATIASQPGDTLLSKINQGAKQASMTSTTDGMISNPLRNPLEIILETVDELGVPGLFRGLDARLVHVTTMVVIQLLVYDFVKQLCGIPATGFH